MADSSQTPAGRDEGKNPVGRPSKFKPEYCEQLIQHMGEGFSFESFAGKIGTHRDTLYEWEKVHPEFSDAKKAATEACRLWWEEKGMQGLFSEYQGRKMNSALWIFNMKNRFKWKDRIESVDSKPEEYKPPESLTGS